MVRLLSLIDVHNNDELLKYDQAQELVMMISDEVAQQMQISVPIQSEQKDIRINRLEQWSQILADTLKSIKQSSQKHWGHLIDPTLQNTQRGSACCFR